jgi:hypothetical protein
MAEEVVPPWRCGAGGEEDEWDQAPSTAMADDGRVLAGLASEVGNSLERVKPTRKWATPFGLPSRAEAGEDPVEEPVMSRKKPKITNPYVLPHVQTLWQMSFAGAVCADVVADDFAAVVSLMCRRCGRCLLPAQFVQTLWQMTLQQWCH